MATKKKSAAKKTATWEKAPELRDLTRVKRALTAKQIESVKGGARGKHIKEGLL